MTTPDTAHASTTLSPAATIDALATSAVTRWWQVTGFLEVAGPESATLLDGLCTQAVERIEPGTGRLGLFLDAKARIVAPAVLHRRADAAWTDPRADTIAADAPHFLLETLPELVEPLRSHLARYRLRARATIEPRELSTVAVVGATTADVVANVDDRAWSTVLGAWRPTAAWIGDAAGCAELVRVRLPAAGVQCGDPGSLEADRIRSRTPALHDLLAGRMPAEVGAMQDAVALDAGCYLGQEPVARLHYRGHANRTLRRLEADEPVVVTPGDDAEAALELRRATDDDSARAVGRLTTWAIHPDAATVALGIVRRELEAGDLVRLAGVGTPLRVVDPPPS